MITMEFEEMKKIWDSQNNEMLFAINEEALHKRVKSKKKAANRVINTTEIGLIIVNSITSIVMFADAIIDKEGFWDYAGAAAMFCTVLYLLFIRRKRRMAENRFDRSLLGELDHAITSAKATLRIASTMVWWYFVPIGFFLLGKMAWNGASIESWLLIIGALVLAFSLVLWENKRCHIPRVNHLLTLKKKLLEQE